MKTKYFIFIISIICLCFTFTVKSVDLGNTNIIIGNSQIVKFNDIFSEKMSLLSDKLIVYPVYNFQKESNNYKIAFNIYSSNTLKNSDFIFFITGNCTDLKYINDFNVTFLLDGYECFYDWIDLKVFIGLKYEIDIKNGFNFKVTVDFIEKNINYVFDPIFGFNSIYYTADMNIEGYYVECYSPMGSIGGYGNFVSAYITCSTVSKNAYCMIYDENKTFMAQTDSILIPTQAYTWINFYFNGSKPLLLPNKYYYISIYGESSTGGFFIQRDGSGGYGLYYQNIGAYYNYVRSITANTLYDSNGRVAIYCNYTEYDTTTSLTLYENIVNVTGSHEYILNSTGYHVWANYTGNESEIICSEIVFFNFSDENITISGFVNCSSAFNSTNYTINEETWLNLASSLMFDNAQIFLFLLIFLWTYFISKYYDTRKMLFSVIQFGVCIPLLIAVALISLNYPFGYVIVLLIPSISLYISVEGILYNKKQKEKR